jgi:rare lipoprotein A
LIAARRQATIALVSLLLVGCASGRGRAPGEPIPDQIEAKFPGPEPEVEIEAGQGQVQGPSPLEMQEQRAAEQEIARGLASWYGHKFHGRRTASGERFDMNDFTAAHPSLPFGTQLTVRNPANGREVAVRVNDRGPHTGRRIIDLSRAAAQAIGLVKAGVGTVVLLRP